MCKTKRDKTILESELPSLKEVTLEGKWFGLSGVLSPKIIYFDSMKNLIHAMRDMNITNSLKASIFDENFTKL